MRTAFSCCLILFPLITLAQRIDTTTTTRPASRPATQVSQKSGMTLVEKQQAVDAAGGGGAFFGMVRSFDNRYEGLQGTPYFSPIWANGRIELANGKVYVDVPLKFDANRQNLILRRPERGNDSIIIERPMVRQFQLDAPDGSPYVFRRYPAAVISDASARGDYFLVLYEGKTTLLKHIVKTFRKASFKDPYSSDVRYDSFDTNINYYLLKPDQTMTKVKKSRKAVLDALGSREAELKAYADKEKINGKTEPELARLVAYFDSLP
jgi:hypothetical protein